jgi:hypothetical protein
MSSGLSLTKTASTYPTLECLVVIKHLIMACKYSVRYCLLHVAEADNVRSRSRMSSMSYIPNNTVAHIQIHRDRCCLGSAGCV